MALKVVQWATGGVGSEAIRHILAHPELELAGVFVYDEKKCGVDAGELAGVGPVGIKATSDRQAILDLEADCVVHAANIFAEGGLVLDGNDADVEALLRSGKNVVSVAGYIWPAVRSPELQARLEDACQQGRVTLFGTGINPGFFLDRMGPAISGLCERVDHIGVRENWDATNYPSPELLFGLVGFGQPEEWLTLDTPTMVMLAGWFGESLASAVHSLGAELERFERSFEYGLATRDIAIRTGRIAKGTLAAVGWTWTAIADGRPLVSITDRWIADWDIPGWGGERAHHWDVDITGVPSVHVRFQFTDTYPALASDRSGAVDRVTPGTTASLAVNAVPQVCSAPRGILRIPTFGACPASTR